MAAASRSLATAPCRARFASGLLHPSCTINRDTTNGGASQKRQVTAFDLERRHSSRATGSGSTFTAAHQDASSP